MPKTPKLPKTITVPKRFYARVNSTRAALMRMSPSVSNKKLVMFAMRFITALQDLDREEQILKHKESIF